MYERMTRFCIALVWASSFRLDNDDDDDDGYKYEY